MLNGATSQGLEEITLTLSVTVCLTLVVAAHELVHGLGFESTLFDYNEVYSRPFPYLASHSLEYESANGSIITMMRPVSIYDSIIYQNSLSVAKLSQDLTSMGERPTSRDRYLDEFENNPQTISAARKLYTMASSNNLVAIVPDGTKIPLLTFQGKHVPGESVSHLHSIYADSADFLMTSMTPFLETPQSLMKRHKTKSILGPHTLKILEAMGYATRNNPNPKMDNRFGGPIEH